MERIDDKAAKMMVDYYAEYSSSMREDILHTQEVVAYTRMIAVGENMSQRAVEMQCVAACFHDIGCPLSRERYGNSLPVNQQKVGAEVASRLLETMDCLTDDEKSWVTKVVGTHHQYRYAKELHFEPLFEADLIANLLSGYFAKEKAEHLFSKMMTTNAGKSLFLTIIGKNI